MTSFQSEVIQLMRDQHRGAIRVAGQWVWPADIRRSPALAEEVYWQVLAA